ncbi:aldose epimerase family protein [Methylobacterium sp. J-068]|uniref:aldose epimerase family protein n=1 Tax=Methylobacterium sp. J-068 TaxID=2836649 RepID=UPI001FB88E27|nr:aldose epimerase family protein [Methylobacterium sp. J-068]MCJ2034752.1 galactose mutarotase [Methylobacterium sp. J-068]
MRSEPFGRTRAGEAVTAHTLAAGGVTVDILDYGGIIRRIEAPDRAGHAANVVLGAADLAGYEASDAHFGALIGRYANRIARGRFTLDGHDHQLPANAGRNTMHGGPEGFDRRVWRVEAHEERRLTLGYRSPDGEQGFPGTLDVTVTYRLDPDGTLAIDYAAVTDRPTILNLTNHSYFNLAGEGAGDVLGHEVAIAADGVLVTDAEQIPTGAIAPVAGTPFDFRTPIALGARIRDAHPQIALAHGYDHTFVLAGDGTLRAVATARDRTSGRRLTVSTTQPGLQLYTANMLDGTVTGSGGTLYRAGDAVCFEAQGYPDAPNHPDFPSTVLRPGERFAATTTYRFSVDP